MLNREAELGLDVLQAELARSGILLDDVLHRLRLEDYHGYLVRIAELCRQVCAAAELVPIDHAKNHLVHLGRLLRLHESIPAEITIWERLFGAAFAVASGPYKFGLFRAAALDDPSRALACVPATPRQAFLAIRNGMF